MAGIDWHIRALEINTCNCDWGCPCQFNARPTHGGCRAAVAMKVESGHFGEIGLDGVIWVQLIAWPGAIHEGGGEVQPIIDDRASRAQVDAIFRILKGEETDPGATIFNVFAATIDKVHKPIFTRIELEYDLAARRGRFAISNLIQAAVEQIRNPVTGAEHRVRVVMPDGFEYYEAEFASSRTYAPGAAVPLDWQDRHGFLARVEMTGRGVVH
jgi:hypothetical protein